MIADDPPPQLTSSDALRVLDQAFHLYRRVFVQCIIYVLLIMIPLIVIACILYAPLTAPMPRGEPMNCDTFDVKTYYECWSIPEWWLRDISLILNLILVYALLVTLVQMILIGTPLTYLAAAHYSGNPISLVKALHATSKRLIPLSLTAILLYIVLILLGIGLSAVTFAVTPVAALITLPIFFYTSFPMLAFVVPVVVLEKKSGPAALQRAWILGKRFFWPIFGSIAIVGMLLIILSIVVPAVVGFVGGVSSTSPSRIVLGTLQFMGTLLFSLIWLPILPISFTVLYQNARARSDRMEALLNAYKRAAIRSGITIGERKSLLPTRNDAKAIFLMAGLLIALLILLASFGFPL